MGEFDDNFGPATRITFGCVYMGLVLIALPIYGAIVWIFTTCPTFRRNPCYRIMSAIGLCDFVYLLGQFGVGLRVATDLEFSQDLERIIYSLPNAGFNGSIILILLLALNRFCVLTNYFRPPTYAYTMAIVAFWLYALAIFLVFAIHGNGILYNPSFMLTVFNEKDALVLGFKGYSIVISPVVFGTSFVLYAFISCFLITKRKQFASVQMQNGINYSKEFKILIQALLMFICAAFININAAYGRFIFPKSYLYTGSLNSFLIFHSGLFYPIVYLSLNSDLRRELKKWFWKKGKVIRITTMQSIVQHDSR